MTKLFLLLVIVLGADAQTIQEVKTAAVTQGIVAADSIVAKTANNIDMLLEVTVKSPAGKYIVCGNEYTEPLFTDNVDPTKLPNDKSIWHVRNMPTITFATTDTTKYTMLLIDETYGYVHGVWINLGGSPGTHVVTDASKAGDVGYFGSANVAAAMHKYVFALYKQTGADVKIDPARETWTVASNPNFRLTDKQGTGNFDLDTFIAAHSLEASATGPSALSWWYNGQGATPEPYRPFICNVMGFGPTLGCPNANCTSDTVEYAAKEQRAIKDSSDVVQAALLTSALAVAVNSPAGTYTNCGTTYTKPANSFAVSHAGADKGDQVTTWDVRNMPKFTITRETAPPNQDPRATVPADKSKYTLMMIDATYGYMHGFWSNIAGDVIDSTTTNTTHMGTTTSSGIFTVLPYFPSANPAATDNTYVFGLYKQTGADVVLSADELATWANPADAHYRNTELIPGGRFNVSKFIVAHALNPKASGMNWWYSKMDTSTQWFYNVKMNGAAGDPLPCPTKPTPAPTPPLPPNFPCPMQGEHYIGISIGCDADCATGKGDMSVRYTPSTRTKAGVEQPPPAVLSACFFGEQSNKAAITATIAPVFNTLKNASYTQKLKAMATANATRPQIATCQITKIGQGTVDTVLPPDYACTFTAIPWCSPSINVDYKIVFSAGDKAKPYTLMMPCTPLATHVVNERDAR
jgi:hypothetical protein